MRSERWLLGTCLAGILTACGSTESQQDGQAGGMKLADDPGPDRDADQARNPEQEQPALEHDNEPGGTGGTGGASGGTGTTGSSGGAAGGASGSSCERQETATITLSSSNVRLRLRAARGVTPRLLDMTFQSSNVDKTIELGPCQFVTVAAFSSNGSVLVGRGVRKNVTVYAQSSNLNEIDTN